MPRRLDRADTCRKGLEQLLMAIKCRPEPYMDAGSNCIDGRHQPDLGSLLVEVLLTDAHDVDPENRVI